MNSKMRYWIIYTMSFICLSVLIFGYVYRSGATLINWIDSLTQQYSSLLYFKRWETEIVETLRQTGKLVIPVYDFNIGFGADILSTVLYFLSVSPLTFFVYFCPEQYLEYFYLLEILFRMYLAGVGFSIYARYHRCRDYAVLVGALSYCFCGYVFQKGIQSFFFILPMFFLPMILLGIDRIIERKSPAVFVIFTALSAINNFYFFYMIVIAAVLYTLCKLFVDRDESIREKVLLVIKIGLYGILAGLIAGAVLFPMVYAILGSSRVGTKMEIPVLYPISYYYNLFFGAATNNYPEFDTRTGYTSVILATVFALWADENERKVKLAFAGLTLLLCVPICGSLLNGGGYVSNRWIFIYSFLLCYIFAKIAPKLPNIVKERSFWLFTFLFVYFLLEISLSFVGIDDAGDNYQTGILLVVFLLGIKILTERKQNEKVLITWVVLSGLFGIWMNGNYMYSPVRGNDFRQMVSRGDVIHQYTDYLPSNMLLDLEDIDSYRSTASDIKWERKNSFMLQKIHGEDFYFSVVVEGINAIAREMKLNQVLEHYYKGMDDRFILDCLTGVKYQIVTPDSTVLPYPGEKVIKETDSAVLYENEAAMPMVYCYDKYIPREEYDLLNETQKQEALLYGAVTDDSSLEQAELSLSSMEIPFEIAGREDQSFDFLISNTNEEICLSLESVPKNAELYLIFDGIHYEGISPKEEYGESLEDADWYTRKVVSHTSVTWQEPTAVSITVQMGGQSREVAYNTPVNRMYCGRDSFLCNLGYVAGDNNEIILSFDKKGNYSFDNIRIVAQPLYVVYEQLNELKKNDLPEWYFGVNCMGGVIECTKPEILCITVPYSIGWKAFVDGTEAEIKRINTGFMGVELAEGKHEIELSYSLPMGNVGIFCFALGLIVFAISCVFYMRRKNNV